MFNKGVKAKVFIHGNILQENTNGLLKEIRDALGKTELQSIVQIPEQQIMNLDQTYLGVHDALGSSESNNASMLLFENGPIDSVENEVLMDALRFVIVEKA